MSSFMETPLRLESGYIFPVAFLFDFCWQFTLKQGGSYNENHE